MINVIQTVEYRNSRILYGNVQSVNLSRKVSVGLVIPEKPKSFLILLHGYKGDFNDINRRLPLLEYANKYNLLIAIPDLGDGYYLDKENSYIGQFVSEELPGLLIQEYPLSENPAVHLSGISMGGYGALLIGLRYPEKFRTIISISGAFIADDIVIGNPEVVGSNKESIQFFIDIFAPISNLEADPERNPIAAILQTEDTQKIPPIILTCGTKDLLYRRNQRVVQLLDQKHFLYHWIECPEGDHVFQCFHHEICNALDFLSKNKII